MIFLIRKFPIEISFINKRQIFENSTSPNGAEALHSTESPRKNIEKSVDDPTKIMQEAEEKAARLTERAKGQTDRFNFSA